MEPALAHGTEHRLGALASFRIAADHESELAFFRPPGAAGDRGIEESHAARLARCGNAPRQGGRDGARIQIRAALAKSIERALRPPKHFFERRRIADDGNEHVGSRCGLARRSEEHTSELQSRLHLVCRLLLEKKKKTYNKIVSTRKKTRNITLVHEPSL